jgi:GGDEF domain-containing protein
MTEVPRWVAVEIPADLGRQVASRGRVMIERDVHPRPTTPVGRPRVGPATLRERAQRALSEHAAAPASLEDPLLPATLRYLDEATGGHRDRSALLRRWPSHALGDPAGQRRYRWNIIWDDDPDVGLAWARRPGQERVLWRPLEAAALRRDPAKFSQRMTLPLILTESLEFLEEIIDGDPALAPEAGLMRAEALPLIETDFALHVIADDPWRDTFALWLLTRHLRTLQHLEPLAIATATRFASRAAREGGGVVRGTDYPFFGRPLRSATAHLASSLWTLGLYPTLIPPLLAYARRDQRPDGGWGDEGQPSDVLTTLAVADLLASLDPEFGLDGPVGSDGADAQQVVDFFARHQEPAGWWRALDPETPWLTAEICRWLQAIERPFANRFRWPRLARWQRDRKTHVPLFAFYEDLARAVAELGALGEAPVEVAFLDLIGFGHWNKANGQELGDEVLRLLAAALREIPESLVVRDGGDEFLVVGTPTGQDLMWGRLEAFRQAWPRDFRAAFGDLPVVAPRIVLVSGEMRGAMAIRERAGIEVGRIQHLRPDGPEGVLWRWSGEAIRT